MIDRILAFSIHNRWLVVVAAIAVAALGAWNFTRLPIDAVPDITNVQVQINTVAPGYSPLEVEQRITFPLETAMGGLPKLDYTRSLSRYGLSQVTVVFKDGTDIYFARQLVNERIQQAKDQLPPGLQTSMGPVSTGLGEIYMYAVEARPDAKKPSGEPYSATDLRTIQDWIIKPQLRTVPGIVEVNTIGGYERQFHVLPDPARLIAYKLTFRDVMAALVSHNANVGAGYIERNGEQYLVRTPGQVAQHRRDPRHRRRLARRPADPHRRRGRGEGGHGAAHRRRHARRQGSRDRHHHAADRREQPDGRAARGGAARRDRAVAARRRRGARDLRPHAAGRGDDPRRSRRTWSKARCWSSSCCSWCWATSAPPSSPPASSRLSMLFTITGMVESRISANLMSLGAIDFGIIVDGAVIVVENCLRLLAEEQHRRGRVLTRSRALRHDPRRGAGGHPAEPVRHADHRRRLPADPHPHRRRGEDVHADGADGAAGADRCRDRLDDTGAGRRRAAGDGPRRGEGEPLHARRGAALCAGAASRRSVCAWSWSAWRRCWSS